jgi:YHS domain-containing protein
MWLAQVQQQSKPTTKHAHHHNPPKHLKKLLFLGTIWQSESFKTIKQVIGPQGVFKMNHNNSNHSNRDPVCGTIVNKNTALTTYRYNGRIFYFCSVSCCDKFLKKPRRYLGKRRHRKLPPRMSLPIGRMRASFP